MQQDKSEHTEKPASRFDIGVHLQMGRRRWRGNSHGRLGRENPYNADQTNSLEPHRRCVIVGGGFGGIAAAKSLSRLDMDVTLIDRHNYHLFQPLSYQVATGSLSPGEIAIPLRRVFRRHRRVRVLMSEVTEFDLNRRNVVLTPQVLGTSPIAVPYDMLIVSAGSSYSYFGHDQWRTRALEVKTLDSALRVRGRILQAFEAAELENNPEARAAWLTFVVVGAGPTGVEMAGQIAELARDTLPGEFRQSDPSSVQVLLVETGDRVLSGFSPALSGRAARSLVGLGVTLRTGETVVDVQRDYVELEAATGVSTHIPTKTIVWAAGVTASPLAGLLGEASGADVDHSGRVIVEPDLTLPGYPEVLAIGDMASVRNAQTGDPQVLPGVAPVAMQQGRYAARVLKDRVDGRVTEPFLYRDKGTLATIGRARAVADIRGVCLSGYLAWLTWLAIHLFYLIGFENRALVLQQWAYSFLTRGRGARLVTEAAERLVPEGPCVPSQPGPSGVDTSEAPS